LGEPHQAVFVGGDPEEVSFGVPDIAFFILQAEPRTLEVEVVVPDEGCRRPAACGVEVSIRHIATLLQI
jgi:hypothetical protein